MSEQEMLDKIKELEERNKFLEGIVNRGSAGNTSAYNAIRLMIIEKVDKEVNIPEDKLWRKDGYIKQKERQLMSDLLWEIRVRRVTELRAEHIKLSKDFIQNYKFEDGE